MDIVGKETIKIDGVSFEIIQHGHQLSDNFSTVEVENVILNGDSLGYCSSNDDQWKICDKIGLPVYQTSYASRDAVIRRMVKDNSVRSLDAESVLDQWATTLSRKHYYPAERKPTGPRPMAGRPSVLNDPERVTIWLSGEQLAWIKAQAGPKETWLQKQGLVGAVIRRLIDEARNVK